MRLILAIRAFLAALFGNPLPPELLPVPQLPPPEPQKAAPPIIAEPKVEPQKVEPQKVDAPKGPSPEAAAVTALGVLQSGGRLLDFLAEDIESYADADIGAAVREVHRGCRKALHEHFKLVPVRSEDEDATIAVPAGYDPRELRLVGNLVGQPPLNGKLKHKGWRASEVRLPQVGQGPNALVIAPAEVEV